MLKLCKKSFPTAVISKDKMELSEEEFKKIYHKIAKLSRIQFYEIETNAAGKFLRVYYEDGGKEDYSKDLYVSIDLQYQKQVEQILENIRIEAMKLNYEYEKINKENDIAGLLLFGGQLSTMLSVMMHRLYPHLSICILIPGVSLMAGSILSLSTNVLGEQGKIIHQLEKYSKLTYYFKNQYRIEKYNHFVDKIEDVEDDLYQKQISLSMVLNSSQEEIEELMKKQEERLEEQEKRKVLNFIPKGR